MKLGFKIVKLDVKYCNYLRQYDYRVSYNAGIKDLRPFIGVLFMVNKLEYFAPLSSPKPKHKLLTNTLDLIKIDNGNLGVVNLNNMIPVTSNNYVEFDLDKKPSNKEENFRIQLLKNQLYWLNLNRKQVLTKSQILYTRYKENELPKNVRNRCCNFILLEEKCKEYNIPVTV